MNADYEYCIYYYTEKNGVRRSVSPGNIKDNEHVKAEYSVHIAPGILGEGLNITVPEDIDGYTVGTVTVFHRQFSGSFDPEYGLPLIKYLYIPSGVSGIHIKTAIFQNYPIPGTIPNTKRHALNRCSVEISPDNPYFRCHKNGIYSKDMTELFYIFSPEECFEVPSGVKVIKKGAGCYLKGLRRLVIPKGVTDIENGAFEGCTDLEYADISAENVGQRAFYGCTALSSLRLDCKEIGRSAFSGCESLREVRLLNTAVINSGAFASCRSLYSLKLPDSLRKIGDHAFLGTVIKHLSLPSGAREIGDGNLFSDSSNTATLEIYLKDGVPPIKRGANPASEGSLLIARSPETGNILFKFIILGSLDTVFTEHGVDFTEYDNIFKNDDNCKKYGANLTFPAALTRLKCPYEMDEETRGFFRNYVSEHAESMMRNRIKDPYTSADDIAANHNLELIDDNGILRLIDETAKDGRTEITAVLMQKLNERRNVNEL